ncbi:MAG: aspartate--tRNA ligase [Acidimicrobiia bacterium]
MRTHRAGELRSEHAGETVAVCGWVASRRDHGGVVFLDVRDAAGVVQVVVDPEQPGGEAAHAVRGEFVVRVEGDVRRRPEGTVNPELPTGEVEVAADRLEVLSEAEPPPIPVDGRQEADDLLRYRYRYLDLRSDRLQRNLRRRAVVNRVLRRVMDAHGFVEIETPALIASTPEGARDFVVPSRLQPGTFYALPQSPQLFKQLLMVGGIDRYYQIARCLRDEDPRADRQFEFMQLDVEMSFADGQDVIAVLEEAAVTAAEEATGELPGAVERMTWHDAMERYGTDKPDVRFGMELVDVSEMFEATEFRAFQGACVKAILLSGGGDMTRAALDRLVDRAKQLGAAGLVWMKVGEAGALESPIAKFLSEAEQLGVIDAVGAAPGDLILVVAGERRVANRVLGALRLDLGRPAVEEGGLRFVWVVEFPLFEGLDDDGRPIPAHHPFTMPHVDDLELLASGEAAELLAVRSQSYDLVLNGWELGSGSVRIHAASVQEQVFSALGISPEDARARFGFLLDAFRYGAPPHAGFAIGIDRFAAVLAGEENIREVTAFPKTQSGADPLTGAPTPQDPAQLEELELQVVRKPG